MAEKKLEGEHGKEVNKRKKGSERAGTPEPPSIALLYRGCYRKAVGNHVF